MISRGQQLLESQLTEACATFVFSTGSALTLTLTLTLTPTRSRSYFDPPDVSKSGCNPAYIGVGRVHVHAPHLFLGFAKPPCPTCGWKSVDQDTIKTKGVCPARRVYAAEMDEWVAGQLMLCTVCKQGSDRLKGEWEELRESYQDDKASEVTEAKAAWKARTYTYRSYNKKSLKFYAERYPGCAPDTDIDHDH